MIDNLKDKWSKWHHIFHKEILNDKNLIPNGSQLLVSVSGGQDSMALLALLHAIKDHHNWSLHVWHGDHGWHHDSKNFADNVKNYCFKKNIFFYLDTSNRINVKTEEKAREWRYKKLCEKASEIINRTRISNKIFILTGHTSTDSTETFFLNLARGSNFAGSGGIQKKRLINEKYFLVRPLLIFNRNDTGSICKDLKIPFWEDPTNRDINLKRNFIRYKIIDELEKIYPRCSNRINNFTNQIRNMHEERLELCNLAIESCICNEGIKRSVINNLGLQTRSTILYYILNQKCIKQISAKNINELSDQILKKENGQKQFPNGVKIFWDKNFIKIKI